MKAFIVYATYRVIEEKPVVHLYGKLENGESFLAKVPFEPYFYIRKKDAGKAKKVRSLKQEKTQLTDFSGRQVIKIIAPQPSEVPDTRKAYEEEGITTYEADIRFVQRYFMDHDILGSIQIKGDYERGGYVKRIYQDPQIAPADYEPRLKTIALDIETDKWAEKVYSFSLYGDNVKEVHIVNSRKVRGAHAHEDEEKLLQAFMERIADIDPDIITGWNGISWRMHLSS
jgi:DNA polymerase-2